MSVAFDAVGPSSSGTSETGGLTTLGWNHTATGSNRLATVGVAVGNANPANVYTISATYNTVSMTLAGKINSDNLLGKLGSVWLFYLINPPTGVQAIVVTNSNPLSASDSMEAGSISFTGVDQIHPIGNFAALTGRGTSSSLVIPSSTGNMIVDCTCDGRSVVSSTQTNRWLNNLTTATQGGTGAGSTAAGAASVTIGYSYNATIDSFGFVAMEIRQVDTPTGNVLTSQTVLTSFGD